MTTAYTSLLGLALPVTGELSGTWGDTVNNAITSLLDTAVAGTTTISSDADVTLTTTTGASNQARQAIILWTASGTATRYITAPAQSKIYTVINKTGSTQSIVIRGAGPTTGVTIPAGQTATVAWNGTDFVDASNYVGGNLLVNGTLTVNGVTTLKNNLLFSADNTYDIGASGATRPRDYFGARNIGAGYLSTSLNASYNFFQAGSALGASLWSTNSGSDLRLSTNWVINGAGTEVYGGNGYAHLYFQNGGNHRWYMAPSNSGGAGVTVPYENNMLLSRYGNLFLGNAGASTNLTATGWGTGYSTLELKVTGTGVAGSSSAMHMFNNAYDTGSGSWVYGVASKYASLMYQNGNSTTWQGTVSTQGAGNAITWETLMQLTMPATNQATLVVGNGGGNSTYRTTIQTANGGYSDQPGNMLTNSNGDKYILWAQGSAGGNRCAMGIGSDYNWWSQSKSFEWWISPTNGSTTVTKQLVLARDGLDFGVSNDSVARRISVAYSTVPAFLSSSYDGTSGITTLSNNIWNTSSGSYSWGSFNNAGYGAACIQLWAAGTGSYITMGAASAANTAPTGLARFDKYGISAGSSAYPNGLGATRFSNILSNANLQADTGSNRVLALDSTTTSGSMWMGLSGVEKYASDWDATAWRRWVNVSGTWYNATNLLPESGLERQEYNPGFIYEVAEGSTFSSPGWQLAYYAVSGGSRSLARDGNGYDASNKFTAPCSGWYHFAAQINFSSCNDTDGTIKLLINGNTSCYGPSSSQLGGSQYPGSRQVSGTMYLTEGDYVQVYIYVSGSTNIVRGSQPYSGSFSGHFVG